MDDAEKFRLLQAMALLKLFKQANGRSPSTTQELEDWAREVENLNKYAGVKDNGSIDPFVVLTPEEIEEALKKE